MAESTSTPVRVFTSYSHDSTEHEERVLALSNRLRIDGVDSIIDQYESPPEGWPIWMERQFDEADFVLQSLVRLTNQPLITRHRSGE